MINLGATNCPVGRNGLTNLSPEARDKLNSLLINLLGFHCLKEIFSFFSNSAQLVKRYILNVIVSLTLWYVVCVKNENKSKNKQRKDHFKIMDKSTRVLTNIRYKLSSWRKKVQIEIRFILAARIRPRHFLSCKEWCIDYGGKFALFQDKIFYVYKSTIVFCFCFCSHKDIPKQQTLIPNQHKISSTDRKTQKAFSKISVRSLAVMLFYIYVT